jgi:hypothetical protein
VRSQSICLHIFQQGAFRASISRKKAMVFVHRALKPTQVLGWNVSPNGWQALGIGHCRPTNTHLPRAEDEAK